LSAPLMGGRRPPGRDGGDVGREWRSRQAVARRTWWRLGTPAARGGEREERSEYRAGRGEIAAVGQVLPLSDETANPVRHAADELLLVGGAAEALLLLAVGDETRLHEDRRHL